MRMIIPCSGYGTRMNMKPNESKEMLFHHDNRLITYSISLAKHFNIEPLVITRIEKQDLIEYCKERNIETLLIEPKGEWADTVLKSKAWWDEDNILVLPDTVFSPKYDTILDIMNGLTLGNNAVFGLHSVTDPYNWGIVNNYNLIEKPDFLFETSASGLEWYAWGIIGFKNSYGEELFSAMTKKNSPLQLKNVGFTYLTEFKDLTRTGKIE